MWPCATRCCDLRRHLRVDGGQVGHVDLQISFLEVVVWHRTTWRVGWSGNIRQTREGDEGRGEGAGSDLCLEPPVLPVSTASTLANHIEMRLLVPAQLALVADSSRDTSQNEKEQKRRGEVGEGGEEEKEVGGGRRDEVGAMQVQVQVRGKVR